MYVRCLILFGVLFCRSVGIESASNLASSSYYTVVSGTVKGVEAVTDGIHTVTDTTVKGVKSGIDTASKGLEMSQNAAKVRWSLSGEGISQNAVKSRVNVRWPWVVGM